MVKATAESEANSMPDEKMLTEMGKFNEERCPNPMPGDSDIEIRPVLEMEDFSEMTPELREQEARLRAQTSGSH